MHRLLFVFAGVCETGSPQPFLAPCRNQNPLRRRTQHRIRGTALPGMQPGALYRSLPDRCFSAVVSCLFARNDYTEQRLMESLAAAGFSRVAEALDGQSRTVQARRWFLRFQTGCDPSRITSPPLHGIEQLERTDRWRLHGQPRKKLSEGGERAFGFRSKTGRGSFPYPVKCTGRTIFNREPRQAKEKQDGWKKEAPNN